MVATSLSISLPARDRQEFVDDTSGQSSEIIGRYLQATHLDSIKSANLPLQVEIEASIPKWNQHGQMKALRKISSVGKITYRVLGFQGDNAIKNQVIARYLQAEQQGQDDKTLALSPANYKFKLKGRKSKEDGNNVYVFQVCPRQKRIGLFKGELWLDATSYLPVLEKGILVRNPSVFFRHVQFERNFAVLNGSLVPARTSSVISTRLVGKVNLSIAYSSPLLGDLADEIAEDSSANPLTN